MKKFWFQVMALLILTFTGLYFYSHPQVLQNFNLPSFSQSSSSPTQIRIIDSSQPGSETVESTISIEVADSAEKRSRGLSDRTSLASDSGMLFVYDKPSQYKFWMKGMQFPLDFIWILNDTIVDLLPNIANPAPNTQTQDLSILAPTTQVNKILEVNAGFIAAHNIKIGDKLQLIK